ncbi:MAG: 50S ribosomal protein L6 [Deltaproteobacteria bacterium]|nr:50S ribosomal protein L6 [Deltaproteobacteria bacterium]
MSRIGKAPLLVPDGVKVTLGDGSVSVEGPKGKLMTRVPETIAVKVEGKELTVTRGTNAPNDRALHGLTRKLIGNMVHGVSQGFQRVLEINGVGYKAEVSGQKLNLTLGFSHPIEFPLPQGVTAKVDRQTLITLESFDKQILGETAARIRSLKSPEPYKGKGIKYQEEFIRRKAGKAVGASS